MVTGGCPDQEGPRAPSRRSDSGGLGLPGFSRPDLAAASSQPVLLTPVSGAHGCAIAKPPESRDVWRVAEASTIETRKRGALARGEGRPPEAAGSRVAAMLASSRGLWTPAPSQCGHLCFLVANSWRSTPGIQHSAAQSRAYRSTRCGGGKRAVPRDPRRPPREAPIARKETPKTRISGRDA